MIFMFKKLINAIKLHRLNKLLSELCDSGPCRNCASYLGNRISGTSKPLCAQWYVCEQSIQKWGMEKKEE